MKSLKMNWGRAVLISLPFFAITAFWQAYDYTVPLILSRHYRLGTTVYSLLMSVDNVVALVFLPLFGALSDRIRGPLGRRTPLILIGTLGGAAGLGVMNQADGRALEGAASFPAFFLGLLGAVFFMSLFRSPSAAMVADCFIRPERTLANAVFNVVGAMGAVLFAVVGRVLITERNGEPVFNACLRFVLAVMLLAAAAYLLLVRENRFASETRERNAALGLTDGEEDPAAPGRLGTGERRSLLLILGAVFFVYMGYNGFHTHYTNYLLNHLHKPAAWTGPYLLEVGLGLGMMLPAAFLTARLGRRRACRLGMAACAAGYFGLSTVTPGRAELIYLWFFIAAVGFPLFGINLGPMVLELSRDRDSGRYMGFYYVAVTAAQIITPTLASLFINARGYGVIGVYGGVCTALALLAMGFVRHGDVKLSLERAMADAAAIDD